MLFLEHESDAPIDFLAVKRCPDIYGPSPIHFASGQQPRVPSALSDIAKVFEVREQLDMRRHLPLTHGAKNHVWG